MIHHQNDSNNDRNINNSNDLPNNNNNKQQQEESPTTDNVNNIDGGDETSRNHHIRNVNDPIFKTLKLKYPAVFDDGVPKSCTNGAGPFSSSSSSASQLLSNAGSSSSSTSTTNMKTQQSYQQQSQVSWTPVYTPPVYFDDDYDRETGQLDVENTIPVTRKVTALTVRKPHHDYLALGDSAGFVLIYSLGKENINRPIARLESVACQQRAKAEQERLRTELQKKRSKASNKSTNKNGKAKSAGGLAIFSSFNSGPQQASSILMDTADTTIHALGMIGERVVLATSIELECMDVPSATSLWVCPLSSNRFVTSLDMHLNTYDVLVSCSKTSANFSEPDHTSPPVSSLMLLQHSKHNVEICDANSPMLVRSPSCTAIWDVGCDNRLLFVALSANRQELELVLVSGGSIDTWKVACKTKIPVKSASSSSLATNTTKLSQSPGGVYTIVASSRGIRLYQTESLQLIHVYGDQLALHGQSVLWKDCWLAGSYFNESKGCSRRSSKWLEIGDWLDQSNSNKENGESTNDSSVPDLAPYIVAVPHVHKGPKELCESLHVWKVEQATVVPAMSIPLPPKGQGAVGIVGGGSSTSSGEDRIVLVTNDGEAHTLLPKMESNFAGIMYPPGYQVITDNIEFIEEEDAFDTVVVDDMASDDEEGEDTEVDILGFNDEEQIDPELKEAMRQSLLEHKRQQEAREAMKHDKDVDILVPPSVKEPDYLPCRPEPYLRQFVNSGNDDDDTYDEEESEKQSGSNDKLAEESNNSTGEDNNLSKEQERPGALFVSNILEAMPNMEKPVPMEEDCLSFTTTKVVVAVNPVVPIRPGRGRKSNLEAMMKASINPYLQSMMLGRQGVAADGKGSRLINSEKNVSSTSDTNQVTPSTFSDPLQKPNGDGMAIDVQQQRSTPDPKPSTAVEAEVALGLLGLSPSPSHASSKPNDLLAAAVAPEVPGLGDGGNSKNHIISHGSAYLSASSLSSFAAANDSTKPFVPGTSAPAAMNNFFNGSGTGTAESLSASSDPGSNEESEVDHAAYKPIAKAFDKTCNACRGRHVIHSCGKRALPIDYDEVAKAEREQREKEEEEKKLLRAEKRRMADQRRREAKKQKQRELEEQRRREDEDERLEKEHQRRLQEDFASQDLNRYRRDQIVQSYAQFQQQPSLEMNSVNYTQPQVTASVEVASRPPPANNFESVARPQLANNFDELSRPQNVGGIFEQAARLVRPASPPHNRPTSAGEAAAAAASYRKHATHVANQLIYNNVAAPSVPNDQQSFSAVAAPAVAAATASLFNSSSPSASDMFGAADALSALAALADATASVNAAKPAPTSSSSPGISSFSYGFTSASSAQAPSAATQYSASHGFGSSMDAAAIAEAKRGIPSYAQINGDTTAAGGANGNSQQQQTVETYVWPPRRED